MFTRLHSGLLALAAVCLTALLIGASPSIVAAEEMVSFKEDVFPVLELRCLSCHKPGGPGYDASGLDLRTYSGLMKGTKHGPVVVPGSALTSNLTAVIDGRTQPELRMPHNKKRMSKCERLLLRFWVNQGAKDN